MPQHSSSAPSYRREAVAVGPFTDEPLDLLPVLCRAAGWLVADWRRDQGRIARVAYCSAEFAAGVALGDHDRFVIGLLADDGWSTVQVVAGWIARAHGRKTTATVNGRRTVVRRVHRNQRYSNGGI